MGSGGAIPGWGADTGVVAPASDRPGIPERLADVWTIYRTRRREVLRAALAVQGSLGVLIVPVEIVRIARFESLWASFPSLGTLGARDPKPFFMAAYGLDDPLAAAAAVLAPTAAFLALLVLTGVLSTLLLAPIEAGRTLRDALRATLRRAPSIALPVLLVAAAAGGGLALEAAWFQTLDQVRPTSRVSFDEIGHMFGLILLVDLLLLATAVVTVYCIVRWAVAVPAIFVEGIGLRASLRRSSELTRGHRVSVGLTLFVVVVATTLVISFALMLVTLAVGAVVTLDSGPGIAVGSIPLLAVWVLLAPFVPLALVVLYRDLELASRRAGA